jgi:hypothetical protein
MESPDAKINLGALPTGESIDGELEVHCDLEEAWAEWVGHMQNVDENILAQLRAAFEAGFAAKG